MDTATVAGHVYGPGGVPLRNARVDVINIDHNTRITVPTNGNGAFVALDLRPGPYRLEVSSPGFKTAVYKNLILHNQDQIQRTFWLSAGSPLESITLDANGMPIQMSAA